MKKKRKLIIYTSHTQPHTHLHTDKKKKEKEKKETHPSTLFSIYMKKLINKVSGESIVC